MNVTDRNAGQNRVGRITLLRALVAFLGAKDQYGWWDCSFLGVTGRKYLAIIHPRSYVSSPTIVTKLTGVYLGAEQMELEETE